jgi:hypothetical protein
MEAMCFDGYYFWTLQKTCEMWNDDKIFKVEVLNLINIPPLEFIPTNTSQQLIDVFPNPAHDEITIELCQELNTSLSIINSEGKFLYTCMLHDQQTQINIENLSSGFYKIVAENEKGTQSIGLIKH